MDEKEIKDFISQILEHNVSRLKEQRTDQEFYDDAYAVKAAVCSSLEGLHQERTQFEKEAAERQLEKKRLEKQRKEQEAEAARLKAEQEKIAAAQKAEADRIAKEKAEAEAALQAEREATALSYTGQLRALDRTPPWLGGRLPTNQSGQCLGAPPGIGCVDGG